MTGDRDSQVPPPRVGRDRRHLYPGRGRAVNARFTDDEYAELADLTPTGFCAQAALDTARTLNTLADKAENHALGSMQAELFHARTALNQLRTDLTLARGPRQRRRPRRPSRRQRRQRHNPHPPATRRTNVTWTRPGRRSSAS